MIAEIEYVVEILFKDFKHSDYSSCVSDIFEYFGKHINETPVNKDLFDKDIEDILLKYKDELKPSYLDHILNGGNGTNTIPYEVLWNLFEIEQQKHK